MPDKTPEALLTEWDAKQNSIPPQSSRLPQRFELETLRILALGRPVTACAVAERLGVPTSLVEEVFAMSRPRGGEWDEQGRLVGNALTLLPTAFEFRPGERRLFTWCAFDALYLPAVLGETAEIRSSDPVTGDPVRLTMAPQGTAKYSPASLVVSVILERSDERKGPESGICKLMRFFSSRESAEGWVSDHSGVTIMTVEEVVELVRTRVLPLFGDLS